MRDTKRLTLGVALLVPCLAAGVYGVTGPVYEQTATEAPERPHVLEEGRKLIKQGKYAEAAALARMRLAEVEVAHGAQSVQAAEVLDVLVESLWRGGKAKDPEARALGERAVAIKERVFGSDHSEVARSLNSLANLLNVRGDYKDGRALAERALGIREALTPNHVDVAESLNTLANLQSKLGDYSAARATHERALAIREEALGPSHPDVAASLNNLGNLLSDQSDYSSARAFHERALAIREKALGPNHTDVATSLNNLGLVLADQGDHTAARAAHERALAIREKTLGPDHPHVASSLNNLALILGDQGDYSAAQALFSRAVAIFESALGLAHPHVALGLNNLGELLLESGDSSAARAPYERALAIAEKALGPDHPIAARSLIGLGRLLKDQGDYPAARASYERALAIQEKVFGPDHADTAMSLLYLGDLLQAQGDYTSASLPFKRSLAIYERIVGPDHPVIADALTCISQVSLGVGDGERAIEAAIRSEDVSRAHLRLTSQALSEREALAYATKRTGALDAALAAAARLADGNSARRGWDSLVRSRALVLDEMAVRHRAAADSAQPQLAAALQELVNARQQLANLVVRGAGNKPELYQTLLDEARPRKERAERALAERSVEFRRQQKRENLGLAEVTAALPSRAVLVAFARYKSEPIRKPTDSGKPSYLAFVLQGREATPALVPLGDASEIESLMERWTEEISAAGDPAASRTRIEARSRTAGAALRARIWDPIAPHVRGAKQVFLVPDAALHLVSFAALPVGTDRYLVENGPVLHLLSAERDLVPSHAPAADGRGLLALGGPAYDEPSLFAALRPTASTVADAATVTPSAAATAPAPTASISALTVMASASAMGASPGLAYRGARSACGELEKLHFEPLLDTLREVDALTELWSDTPDSRRADVVQLSGAAASEAAFKDQAPRARILHLATHGFFLGDRCVPDKKATPAKRGGPTENPLLLSGLVLAGANHRASASADEDDGILTAEEVAALDLSGVEWAVLSACETGTGDVRAGEGVFGLRRAFQVAGARTLIMSLWSVDDASTRRWMEALYDARLKRKRTTAEAVRDASLTLLRERRKRGESTHPFFWAGFVAAGDWR